MSFKSNRLRITVALANLLLAACIGALLRFAFVEELTWMHFRKFLHGHSHVAMLGWVYLALFTLLVQSFLPSHRQHARIYTILFWATQFTVLGMLVSFPIQGYAAWSIGFSSAHVLLSYVFAVQFWRDLRNTGRSKGAAALFARTALVFMILSTLALWAMAPIIILESKHTALYYIAVQFFLHFQFNGWFLFGVLALLFRILEDHNISLPRVQWRRFYLLLTIATLPTFALAVAWSQPHPAVFWTNSAGVLVQLAALIYFLPLIRKVYLPLKTQLKPRVFLLLQLAFFFFVIKILIQTSVVVPYIATVAYTVRNYVIGFIHLVLLGVITTSLLACGAHRKILSFEVRPARAGLIVFLAGFFLSELLLFVQGTMLWAAMGFLPYYYLALFALTLLLPLGVALLLLGQLPRWHP